MLARIRKSIEEKDQGFTLIELLVVMIIIGILAAIAIPVFLNQRKKAQDSAAKADVSTIGKEIATYYVDNPSADDLSVTINDDGQYELAGGDLSEAQSLGKASDNVVIDESTDVTDSTTWCVAVTNEKGDKAADGFRYSAAGGLEQGTCD